MFEQADFDSLQHAAKAASDKGDSPALTTSDQLRDEAMKRKILRADVVARTEGISQNDLIYIALNNGLMEGFYIVDFGKELAWRWEAEDEGEMPYICNPPATTASGLPKICATCKSGEIEGFSDRKCIVHKLVLSTHHTCREWANN